MGTFALGELMTTKPYVSGSAYVNRMSDYCKGCAFHPTKTCPWTSLYWAFLDRHEDRLAGNFRMSMPLRSLGKRAPERRARDRWVREQVLARLRRGSPVGPEDFEDDESGAA
jgi:deoxyribodipyrimidine photolyase-related protein